MSSSILASLLSLRRQPQRHAFRRREFYRKEFAFAWSKYSNFLSSVSTKNSQALLRLIEPAGVDEFWDFTSDILKELVDKNYSGKDLLREFEVRKEKAGRGLERMVAEAREDVKAGRGRPVQDIFPLLLGENDV